MKENKKQASESYDKKRGKGENKREGGDIE
jgi:hypothetical protein